ARPRSPLDRVPDELKRVECIGGEEVRGLAVLKLVSGSELRSGAGLRGWVERYREERALQIPRRWSERLEVGADRWNEERRQEFRRFDAGVIGGRISRPKTNSRERGRDERDLRGAIGDEDRVGPRTREDPCPP